MIRRIVPVDKDIWPNPRGGNGALAACSLLYLTVKMLNSQCVLTATPTNHVIPEIKLIKYAASFWEKSVYTFLFSLREVRCLCSSWITLCVQWNTASPAGTAEVECKVWYFFVFTTVFLHTSRKWRKNPQISVLVVACMQTIMSSSAKLWPISSLQCLEMLVLCLPPITIRQMNCLTNDTGKNVMRGGWFIRNLQKQSWHSLVTAHHIPAEPWWALCLSHHWTPCGCCWCRWHRWSVSKWSCFPSSQDAAPAACTSHGWNPLQHQHPVSCLRVESNERSYESV